MSSCQKINSLTSPNFSFVQSGEYDVVSIHDIVLMSGQNYEKNTDRKEKICDSFQKYQIFSRQYEEEWNELFKTQEINIAVLKQKSVEEKLRSSHFRSICWRVLLGILHSQPAQWLFQLQTYRKHYNEICTELDNNPWNINSDISFDNPLSQESESVWQKYFCDKELKAVILQDVKRTFPDIDYFRGEEIQKIMVRILFCYARQNPILCYRQGMHEILAPLILVLRSDHQAFLQAKKLNPEIDKNICDIMSPEFLEHDAYSIFKNVMSHIQCSYRISNMKEEQKTEQNEIIERLDFIKKNIFQKNDPELSAHLEKLNIPMHLFGIRWLRLLFGREFFLQDLLALWDFLFANNFENVNHVVVAMLVAIRQILLEGDFNTCLSTLMKYPSGVNMSWVIAFALHLKEPTKNLAPDSAQLKLPIQQLQNHQTLSQLQRRLKRGSSGAPKWFPAKHNVLKFDETDSGNELVAHGVVSHNSKFPEIELEQIKVVLSVVHHKLLQFHSLLKAKLQDNLNPDIELIIDGIYELSCFLKNYNSCEIETACEAGESKERDITNASPNEKYNIQLNPSTTSINLEIKSHSLPNIKRGLRSGELKVFKHQIGGCINGAPMTDPLHLIKDSDALSD